MKKKIILIILLITVIGGGWYTYHRMNTIKPTYNNMTYSTLSKSNVLDIYIPSNGTGPYPVVIQIHGGAFKMGDKADVNSLQRLLDEGFAVISINYRLSSEAKRPAQLDDLKAVIQFIKSNGKTYNIDTERIASRGYSAGGYLSAMMGIALANDPKSAIQASIDRFGPVDFFTMDEDMQSSGIKRKTGNNGDQDSPESALLGVTIKENKDIAEKASVLAYLSGAKSIPPFLIMHGAIDPMIAAKQSERLRDAIHIKFGTGAVEYHLLPNGGHGDGDFKIQSTEDLVIKFLKKHL